MTIADYDYLPVALRAFAVRVDNERPTKPRKVRRQPKRRRPHRTLVLDTETTTDASQRLTFGVWRYYIDDWDGERASVCVEEGVFYADDLADDHPTAFASLAAYVDDNASGVAPGRSARLHFLSRRQFLERILWRYAYKHRATVVGFNLPFDLSRLAVAASEARRSFDGGISLQLWEHDGRDNRYRPRVAYKTIDSRRSLIGFTTPEGVDEAFRGHFLDLRTLSFALTDRGHSLESACAAFGVAYTKRAVAHGTVSEDYITYCREDVAATAALYRAAMSEYARHPIALQPTKAFSPASIGKAYLEAMGVRSVLSRQPRFPRDVLGWGMAAFFGGRAECRMRRVPVPVVYCDFLSMYPTCNALMGTWQLLTAARVTVGDATRDTTRLLADVDLFERCFDQEFWSQLLTLVELEPDGDVLPVRAAYDPAIHDYGIGVNPFRVTGSAWYCLADVVASVILTGRLPRVRRALRLRGVGEQPRLRALRLRDAVDIDPRAGDVFRTVIEERKQVQSDPGLDLAERNRLSQFLKVFANATSYGILAEFVRREQREAIAVTVSSDGPEAFECRTDRPEDRGPYCFPPVAACITGAARLMLALLERCVAEAGGTYAFCDTDSMAIVASRRGGSLAARGNAFLRALPWTQVDEIVARFEALNPYDRDIVPGSILKIEDENFDESRRQRQLWSWAISAKRYVLYTAVGRSIAIQRWPDSQEGGDADSHPTVAKASEHGLGHLLNPTDPTDTSADWITQAWAFLLGTDGGKTAREPTWLHRPALSRITVSTPTVRRWFARLNADRPYAEQVKPGNFLLVAHRDPLDSSDALPIAPYESDPARWENLAWIDCRSGHPVRITTAALDGTPRPGCVRVRTYGDVLGAYATHPEPKSLAPDGKPVGRATRGLLRRRPVEGIQPPRYIGKEGNRLDERVLGLLESSDEYRNEYVDPRRNAWTELVVPVLRTIDRGELGRVGLHRRTLERILFQGVVPHARNRETLAELARDHAVAHLTTWSIDRPRDRHALLQSYLDTWASQAPRCQGCDRPVSSARRKWCSAACRRATPALPLEISEEKPRRTAGADNERKQA